jgi:pyridoxamine 5'-phosphate oxidase
MPIKVDLHDQRQSYERAALDESSVNTDPIAQFQSWFNEVKESDIPEPNAMTLATATKEGKPSARIVLLKEFSHEGFIFYTNYLSRKGEEILQNPHGALLFFWDELERQVRIEGQLKKVSAEMSDAYFAVRPKQSQMGAIVSQQSSVITGRQTLEQGMENLESAAELNRPDNWGGYILVPDYFEFWQGRRSRLHDRIIYIKQEGVESWKIQRLAP